jgi:phosphoinositide-3-kinase regulatory subunit 4
MVAVENLKPTVGSSLTTLIEVWDIENSVLVESYATRASPTSDAVEEPREVAGRDADDNPASAIAALVRTRQSAGKRRPSSQGIPREELLPTPSPDVRAIVVGLEFGGHSAHRLDIGDISNESSLTHRSVGRGFMINGSEDRKIRLWDLGRPERTTILSGLESDHDKPAYRYVFISSISSR